MKNPKRKYTKQDATGMRGKKPAYIARGDKAPITSRSVSNAELRKAGGYV